MFSKQTFPVGLTKGSLAAHLNGVAISKLSPNHNDQLYDQGLIIAWAHDTSDFNECIALAGGYDDDITLRGDTKLFIYSDLMGQYCLGDQEEYGKDMGQELPENQPFLERKYVTADNTKGVYEMTASFPFAPFTITKHKRPFCIGLVFYRSDLDDQLALVSA